MDQAVAQNQDLAERLQAALRRDEFILYGQRIAPLAATDGGRPFQEILIRFQEEEAKLLPPGSFFPILEDCGLMPYVDRWVVNRIARWVRSALTIRPDWPVPHNGINLSAATLADPHFAEHTRKQLCAAALPAGTVSFEITCDSAAGQVQPLQQLMARLKPEGCRFILARFGGGAESFALLRRLKPEFVKLSPSLVRMLGSGAAGLEQLGQVNRDCHALGAQTIAEHVESNQTLAQLRDLGVDYGQGFGIQVPQPLA
jgi:ammonium transporter, Amt family